MNVGFRPRLRARPSLYDLIAFHSIERLSLGVGSIPVEDLPPLPESTTASPLSPAPDPIALQHREPEAPPVTMAPKKNTKPARDADEEEQHGSWRQTSCARKRLAN